MIQSGSHHPRFSCHFRAGWNPPNRHSRAGGNPVAIRIPLDPRLRGDDGIGEVRLTGVNDQDYVCLTDIARYKNAEASDDLIRNWLRNRNTLEFLGIWEQINNPDFNPVEFDGIKKLAGLNSFTLTPKQWIERTGAVGIQSKAGRYGGTYAHLDIALEFASWISVEFKLYLIKEFQRLKETERQTLGWDIRRNLAKINYRIHTDAIQTHLIPP